jgi:ADP-ribosylglycohydrolase
MNTEDQKEIEIVLERIKETEKNLNAIRGSIFGGAVGDALGYPVEFLQEDAIFKKYGKKGITEFEIDPASGKALISDDTQMTLFTANGLLVGDTRDNLRGIRGEPRFYVFNAYKDWYKTQQQPGLALNQSTLDYENRRYSWLLDVPELYSRRAPGNTCLAALRDGAEYEDYIEARRNDSKGCGGIMRIAPVALDYHDVYIEAIDLEAAQIAASTHGHSLGYMPAAMLAHIINRIVFPPDGKMMELKDIILESMQTATKLFAGDENIEYLVDLINLAISLAQTDNDDLENIHRLGEGWVAEETLAIAVYCTLKYQNDFESGVVAAVNHKGDSDSTGAVTGNILGALLGYDAIPDKWKHNLEISDVILEIADDICHGCQMEEYSSYHDEEWTEKYVHMRRPMKKTEESNIF